MRAGTGQPAPIRPGGQGFERARTLAAGSIDLPGPAGTQPPTPSIGADDGPRRRERWTGPCQAPIQRERGTPGEPSRVNATRVEVLGADSCSRVMSSPSRRQASLADRRKVARRDAKRWRIVGRWSVTQAATGGSEPRVASSRPRGLSRTFVKNLSVSGSLRAFVEARLGTVHRIVSDGAVPARASEPRVANEGPTRDPKLDEECAEPGEPPKPSASP